MRSLFDASNESLYQDSETQIKEILRSDHYRLIGTVIVFSEMFFSLLGVITNAINIRVFVEQGPTKSSTTLGLLCLSTFDMLNCLLLIASELCVIFDFTQDRPKRVTCGTVSSYAVFISVVFYYCSNWTTVYLSIERTLCVVIPLKVKLILRPKVTLIVITSIFMVFFSAQTTYSTATRVVMRFDEASNRTLPNIAEPSFAKKYLYFYSLIANTILSSVAIAIVTITTFVMIRKLSKFQKWRRSNVSVSMPSAGDEATSEKTQMSSKDAEMVKSVITVTCIFLVCLSAGHIPATVILVIPGATFSGINRNLFFLGYQLRFVFSLVNSSINFFFYIQVSSRYKESFAVAFPKCSSLLPSKGH